MSRTHQVVIVVFPQIDLLDVTGPAEVFSTANQAIGREHYQVRLAAPRGGAVTTKAGVRVLADLSFAQVSGSIGTLLVPGAVEGTVHQPRPILDPEVVDWVRATAPHAARVASVCVGAHVLAAAGLLDGLRATTHWSTAARLAADHPAVLVDPDPIFLRDGRIWTGAGVSACLDLALALVTEDHGQEVALAVARAMVMYLKRPGGQSQFSVPLSQPATERRELDRLRTWISEHLTADLSAAALAERIHLSLRHFARVFRQETGTTPAAYVEAARVEAARRLLESTDATLADIAADTGLGSVETLHRAFRRQLTTTPADYRRRFRTTTQGVTQ